MVCQPSIHSTTHLFLCCYDEPVHVDHGLRESLQAGVQLVVTVEADTQG